MRRFVTTAMTIALVGGAALAAPAGAADDDRRGLPGSAGVVDPGDLLELTPEAPLPVLEEQLDPTASETLSVSGSSQWVSSSRTTVDFPAPEGPEIITSRPCWRAVVVSVRDCDWFMVAVISTPYSTF